MIKMKRWPVFLLLLLPITINAQGFSYNTISVAESNKENNEETNFTFDKTKLRFGANLGLSVSRNYTYLGLGPQAGYQFNQYFMAGGGVKYYYYRAKLSDYENKNNLLGINIFGYSYPIHFITIFAQPELNYIWSTLTYNSTGERVASNGFAPSLIVGAGLRLGYTHITINYDLLQHHNSPHPDSFYLGVSAFF